MRHWTTEHDLPQNRIGCLKQTLDGYLWIGTWSGLVRFDGVHFTPFNKFNTPELVNDAINTLAQDAGGTLWIGTHDGLVSYREHRFQRFAVTDGLPDRNVVQSVNSRSGGVWLQAGDSVVRFDREKFSESRLLDLTRGDQILSMHAARAHCLELHGLYLAKFRSDAIDLTSRGTLLFFRGLEQRDRFPEITDCVPQVHFDSLNVVQSGFEGGPILLALAIAIAVAVGAGIAPLGCGRRSRLHGFSFGYFRRILGHGCGRRRSRSILTLRNLLGDGRCLLGNRRNRGRRAFQPNRHHHHGLVWTGEHHWRKLVLYADLL